MSDETPEERKDELEGEGMLEDGLEEEYEPEEPPAPPRRVHIPRPVTLGVLAALALVLILTSLWGLSRGTLTYGMWNLDADTTAHLKQVYDDLAAAGAPETALRRLAVATQPGINIGNAVEAITDAGKVLEPMSDRPAIASALQRLGNIYATELCPHLWYVRSGECSATTLWRPTVPLVTPVLP